MKSYTKKGRKVKLENFKQIKIMQEHGSDANQIHEMLGWGVEVIKKCMQHDTMESYQAWLDDKYAKRKQALQNLTPQTQTELDMALDDWKAAFDNRLTYIDNSLDEIKDMINTIDHKQKGFWK